MTREKAATILYKEWQRFLEHNLDYAGISDAYMMAIKALEQQKVGRWCTELVEGEDWKGRKRRYYQPVSCSECHKSNGVETNYCPNCGARMESEGKK